MLNISEKWTEEKVWIRAQMQVCILTAEAEDVEVALVLNEIELP